MATLPTTGSIPLDIVATRYMYAKVGGREYKDQKYKRRPLLQFLNENKMTYDGGPRIAHPVDLGSTNYGGSLSRNQRFSIQSDLNQTWSVYTPSVLFQPCFISWWDTSETRGNKFKMQSVMDSAIGHTEELMNDKKATMLSQTTAADSDDINPILPIVKTTGATGGLNPSNSGQDQWAAQSQSPIAWATEGVGKVRAGVRSVEDVKGKIDVILVPDTTWDETCEIGDQMVTINQDARSRGGTKYADLGLQVPFILNIPVIHDPAWNTAQTATGVGLDLRGIHFIEDSMFGDYMYPFKEMAQHGALGVASVKIWKGQLTCSSRRTQLLLGSIS